jgi:methylmalonyl-CoA carboxyltransferase small subunit
LKIQIVTGGKAYEVEVEVEGEEHLHGVPGQIASGSALQSTRVPTVPRPGGSGVDAGEAKVCRSPVAGIVMRVQVLVGEQLQVDSLIVVLEAMKMETSVTAPIAGRVKSVNVVPGQAVKLNQILVEFE